MSARHSWVPLVCASFLAGRAFAAEEASTGLDYELRAGATYSDNIVGQPSPFEEAASALAFGAEVRGDRPTGRLRYETAMELWYYQYLDYFSGGELFGRGMVAGSYDIVPENFRWNASLNFDQQREDLTRPLVPGNVEDLITLATGPTLRANLFGSIDSQLDAHYIRALYSGDSFDSDTFGGRVVLGHRTGRRSSLGIGGSIDDVSYLSGAASSLLDFERREAFVRGEISGVRTNISAEFGYAEAVGDSFNGDGPLARVSLQREMSPSLSAYLGYRHEFPTSQVTRLISDPTPSGGGVVDTSLVTSAPRETWTGDVGFRFVSTRSEASIGYYHVTDESLIPLLGSHTYDELRARLMRRFTPRSSGSGYVAFSKEDFSAFNQNFDDVTVGLEYSYELTRSIGIDVRMAFRDRNSNIETLSFNELNGGVFIRYSGSLLGRSVATPRDEPGQ